MTSKLDISVVTGGDFLIDCYNRIADKATMLKLIDTLRIVTAGKIYVENERARLTHRLSLIHEADDNVTEAAKIMQELQVTPHF